MLAYGDGRGGVCWVRLRVKMMGIAQVGVCISVLTEKVTGREVAVDDGCGVCTS